MSIDSSQPPSKTLVHAANVLTGVRFILAPILGWAVWQSGWSVAAIIVITAIGSDVLDGRMARRHGVVSAFGGFFDHGTDALFVSIGAWALAEQGLISPWLWPCIALAFIQYAADSRVLKGRHLRTSRIGKYNGLSYYAVVTTAIGSQALYQAAEAMSETPVPSVVIQSLALLDQGVLLASWILVFTTLISMADRLYHSIFQPENPS
jgi:phosphatidylglycerophosphate synthase